MTHAERLAKMTPEQKKAYDDSKAKSAADYKIRKAAAKKVIMDFFIKNPNTEPEFIKSVKYLIGEGERSARTGVTGELRALFIERKSIPAVELFTKYEYGRTEGQRMIKLFLNCEPDDRLWIKLEDGKYILGGQGPKAPVGWTGYIPVVKETL